MGKGWVPASAGTNGAAVAAVRQFLHTLFRGDESGTLPDQRRTSAQPAKSIRAFAPVFAGYTRP